MTTIKLKTIDENLEFTSSPPVYSGDVNTIAAQFEFDEFWEGFVKTAVFYREIKQPYQVVLKDDICNIPSEVMLTEGRIYIGVFGVLENKVKTSEVVYYDIGTGVMTYGTIPEPSDEIWQQILSELANIRELAQNMTTDQEEFQQQITQDNNQFKQNMAQSFNEYKTNTNESIKETLEKYGDMVVMMDIGEYIEPADRKTGSLYFNATERIDKVNDLIKVSPNMGVKIIN